MNKLEEKDAEIERLKKRLEDFGQKETYKEWQRNQADIERLKLEIHNEKEYAADVVTTLRCEAEDHKRLCARAAEALEEYVHMRRYLMDIDVAALIAELRKAAE